MSERILVCVAWPYANYLLHVGQAAGAYLPSDIFARYHRLKGNEVLMVSGSDCHGTPITVAADKEGVEPQVIVERYHAKILEVWERFGISFDLYTSTLTENHYAVTQDMFLRLKQNNLLYPRTEEYLYDPEADRFLPDRYVEGTCPNCGYSEARGDQCDNCGKTLDAVELINPRSKISGATPILRPSEHHFLRLSAMEGRLKEWVSKQAHWRRNVLNFTLGMLNEGLKDRAITRDIYDADVIRFYLTSIMPESTDSDFREDDLVRANNDVLISTWGNLANRVISMLHRNFGGVVPESGPLAPESTALLREAEAAFDSAGAEFEACHFRAGLQEGLKLAQAANKYLDDRAPWKAVKTDLAHAGETLATALSVINALKVILHPVLPFSTTQLHSDLGLAGELNDDGWAFREFPAGTTLGPVRPLYTKIETEPVGVAR